LRVFNLDFQYAPHPCVNLTVRNLGSIGPCD
jgi:hypothetical protein